MGLLWQQKHYVLCQKPQMGRKDEKKGNQAEKMWQTNDFKTSFYLNDNVVGRCHMLRERQIDIAVTCTEQGLQVNENSVHILLKIF